MKKKPAKKKPAKKKAARAVTRAKLAFDHVLFHGVGLLRSKGRKRVLHIFANEAEAIRGGVDPETARLQFDGRNAMAPGCTIDFGSLYGVECDDTACSGGGGAKTCHLEYWDAKTKSWVDTGSDSAGIAGSKTWRCSCR